VEYWYGNLNTLRKPCPCVTLTTTHPTSTALWPKLCLLVERQVSIQQSFVLSLWSFFIRDTPLSHNRFGRTMALGSTPPQPPGALRAYQGLYVYCFTFLLLCLRCLIFHVPNCTWSPSWRVSTTTYDSTTAAECLPTAPISQSTGRSDWKRANIPLTTSSSSQFGPKTDTHHRMYRSIFLARITLQIQIIFLKRW
jgi:hypothetical protein